MTVTRSKRVPKARRVYENEAMIRASFLVVDELLGKALIVSKPGFLWQR
jgi:hypothetical protein